MLKLQHKYAVAPSSYAVYMGIESMGERIRERRLAKGMTQLDLANAVGVTESAVSQWELGGTKNIKLDNFLRLLDVLDVTHTYLVHGTAGAPRLPDPSPSSQSCRHRRVSRRG